jgi:excisionase family DNA binding protein
MNSQNENAGVQQEHYENPISVDSQPIRFLTAEDVARQLNIAKTSVYDLVARGRIAFYRIGRLVRFRQVDVDAFLAAQRSERVAHQRSYDGYPKI